MEHLARGGKYPATISNIISHLGTFYLLLGLSTCALNHTRVGLALRAIAISIRHVPDPKQPVTPALLKAALAHIEVVDSPRQVKFALLLMYMGFMWQSSVAPSSLAKFDPTRHLVVADIVTTTDGLTVKLKWQRPYNQQRTLPLLRSLACITPWSVQSKLIRTTLTSPP